MSDDEVNRVLDAAETLGEIELLAMRLAAVTGARRAEVGALKWSDFDGNVVRIDSALVAMRVTDEKSGEVHTAIYDTPTKTGDLRIVTLDPDPLDLAAKLRAAEKAVGRGCSATDLSRRTPAGSDGGGRKRGSCPRSILPGDSTISAIVPPPTV
jgi:integrase